MMSAPNTLFTLNRADERFFPTTPIVPMEEEMLRKITDHKDIDKKDIEFRQRVTSYHIRFRFWKQLPETLLQPLKDIAAKYGYELRENVDGPDDDRMTRYSYDLTHKHPYVHESVRQPN